MAKNDLQAALTQLPAEQKEALAVAALEYAAAKQSGADSQAAYNRLRDILKNIEHQCDVTIFVPIVPEAKMIDAIATKVSQKKEAQAEPEHLSPSAPPASHAAPLQPVIVQPNTAIPPANNKYSCSFDTLNEANHWLAQYRNLTVINMQTKVSRVGLDIEQIWLEYKIDEKAHNQYQLTEKMQHRFFVGCKLKNFRTKWEKKNPEYRYIAGMQHRWHFSLIGGSVGFFRYIKEKYIVLYTPKK